MILVLFPSNFSFPNSVTKSEKKEDKPKFELKGIFDVFTAIKTNDGAKKEINGDKWATMHLNILGIILDASYKNYGIHLFYIINESFQYMEEGYFYAKLPFGETYLKIGIIRTPFGLQIDNTWFLNYFYYAGLIYDSDYGVVFDGTYSLSKYFYLQIQAGYFNKSNGHNGSFFGGPKDLSIEQNYEERDSFVGRLRGTIKTKNISLALGGSIIIGDVSLPDRDDSKYFMYEMDLEYKWSVGTFKDFVWILAQYVNADLDKKNYTTNLSKYQGYMVGLAIKPLQNLNSKWISWVNIHGNYSWIHRRGSSTTDLLIVGTSIGFTKYFIFTVEYIFGRKDITIPINTGTNRFQDGLFIDLVYLINF